MNKALKKALYIPIVCLSILPVISCKNKDDKPKICDYEIIHEPEFGGAYVKITIDDFNDKGFEYGDSVDVTFSNDFKYEDLPYYNGYYVDAGNPLLIAYPGYDYIKVAINYGADVWDVANLNEDVTCSIKLNKAKKYYDIQMSSDIHYTDDINDYENDPIIFSNFRNITVGNIKENKIYRSASPIDNQHLRAHYVDELIKEKNVAYIMDLSDDNTKIDKHIAKEDFNSPYFKSLYDNNKVEAVAMNMNYYSSEFTTKIAQGFKAFAKNEGPYLIHCVEGKDRTGFVCMVIEALCGATYQEIVDDYM
ncbi:MAG: tyrosine-protein phosphatase, partial [Acholeplasmatales bacterium]|nr:tyrosine-protein phosphatase [Acholeplasmatales bacterium]